jgi:ABC-type polar amino acid transport system ATPase subunit
MVTHSRQIAEECTDRFITMEGEDQIRYHEER